MANDSGGNQNGSKGSFHLQAGRWALDIASVNLLTILTVLGLFLLVGGAGYLQLTFINDARAEHTMIRQEHIALRDQLDEKLEVMIYLLSRGESERPNLAVPYGLQRRIVPDGMKE